MPATYLNSRRRSNPASPGRAGIGPAGQNTCAMKKLFPLIAVLATLCATAAQRPLQLIPQPVRAELREGHFAAPGCKVTAEGFASRPEGLIRVASALAAPHGKQPARKTRNTLLLQLDARAGIPAEGYRLRVAEHEAELTAGDESGIFYGLQTLLQMADADGNIPCAEIEDYPRYGYRGLHLDVCRHFFPVEFVKGYLDRMAAAKLNRFHWHLTDDQGWRIEIKRYPLLTEIGSVRRETVIGRYDKTDESRNRYDGKPYGGFYTQDDVRAIVAYAAERYIEVIPEIDMPGHMLGALASYPQLGCRGKGYEVWTHWGISKDVLCAGKEETFEFVENVLAEVLDLFPSKFIHVGGDECPKERWKECPACQRRIREEGLANENELQSYFMHRVEKWLHEHGRELIGWDEIMQGGISKSAVIMAWTDQFRGTDAARKGNRVIMTPKWNCYLDYSQTSDPEKYEPIGPTRYLSMRQVYRLDPYDRLKPAEYRNILGIQGNVWTEYIADFGHVQRMTLPRMAAIAEIAWAYDRKDYDDFEKRAKRLLPELYGNAKLKFSEFFFEDIE